MKHFNRAAAILVCLFIIAAPFTRCFYSYADSTTDNWQNVTTNEQLVEVFRYYCKSRDLTIDGSAADVVTKFTTQTFNNLCNGIGIDVTALQAHLKYETDNAGNIKYLFDSTGITAYNQIFAQFLQDNNLSVGDSIDQNDPDVLYSGKWFVDADGNGCLVYTRPNYNYDGRDTTKSNAMTSAGTPYIVNDNDVLGWTLPLTKDFHVTSSQTIQVRFTAASNSLYRTVNATCSPTVSNYTFHEIRISDNVADVVSHICVIYTESSSTSTKLGLGACTYYPLSGDYKLKEFASINSADQGSVTNANVFIYTDNSINNNNYEGDTIINNNGTPGNDDPSEPSGGTPPNWDLGGGQGTAEDGNGNTWNITWPSFELPDLNIDWSIHGLSEKFPFSIPFDLVSLVTVLSAEPEAPQFTGTVDLKVYQWNYDLDFSQFDTVAAVFRTAETLLFVFGLIMITRKIIRG